MESAVAPPEVLYKMMCVWSSLTGEITTTIWLLTDGVLRNARLLRKPPGCLPLHQSRKGQYLMFAKNFVPPSLKIFQLRTPFNCLLINLSSTELIISVFGNSLLAYNSFYRGETSLCLPSPLTAFVGWTFSSAACQANAFGMTFLGDFNYATMATR